MAQEVHHIKIFPEEQIQVLPKTTNGGKDFYRTEEGLKKIDDNTVPMWGVARVGDQVPTGYRTNITPAKKIPNRIPRIPCQFVVIAFDSAGNKINGGDVKDGFLYNGAKLPNGNKVELKWSATMQNKKCKDPASEDLYIKNNYYGDNRKPFEAIQESANQGDDPTKWLGFTIDDTGLLIPGNDGNLDIKPPNNVIGGITFNTFQTDRTCDGFVKVDYAEIKADKTKANQLPQVTLKAVIAQPDWAVEKDTPKGWGLP